MCAESIAFVCPRFSEGPTVGGAETLLKNLALRAAARGFRVDFLTTCASDHFTWANDLPAGRREFGGMQVHFFPVNENRDVDTFLRVQGRIGRGTPVSVEEEEAWLANSVNSAPLCDHLRANLDTYDHVVGGPYLFGLTYAASRVCPDRFLLVPCLHDEPFAYLQAIRGMFHSVAGLMFNAEPERDFAIELYGIDPARCFVVGTGLEPFEADPLAFAARTGITSPYIIYCGRREPLKGTPLLLDYMNAFRSRTGRDVKLVFVGSGNVPIPDAMEGHVIDAGFLTDERKREAMAGAVAFCHPSVNESLSIVILESWLARVPVLVNAGSRVMQWQCRVSNGGLWFRSYPEFEESLLIMLDNSRLRSAMGEAGRSYVMERYAWQRIETDLLAALAWHSRGRRKG